MVSSTVYHVLSFCYRALVVGRQSNNHSGVDHSKTIIYNQQEYNTSKIETNSRSHVISPVFMAVLLGAVDSKHPSARTGFPRRLGALGTNVTTHESYPGNKMQNPGFMWRSEVCLGTVTRVAMRVPHVGWEEDVVQ
jgi:hypothetical protein